MKNAAKINWKKSGKPKLIASKFGKNLTSQNFINPKTGKPEEFYVFDFSDGSIILPITKDKKVVAVKEFHQAANKVILGLPAGRIDLNGEKPAAAAKRELLEETGYKAGKIIFLGPPQYIAPRHIKTKFYAFLALDCEKVNDPCMDKTEEIIVSLLPLKKWLNYCLKNNNFTPPVLTTIKALPYLGYSIKEI